MWTAIIIALGVILVALTRRDRPADHSEFDQPLTKPVIEDAEVSKEHADVVARLAAYTGERSRDVSVMRQRMEDLFFREVDSTITPVDVDGIPAEWVVAEGADTGKRLLYLHGGAFMVGSPKSHRFITDQLSRRCGVAVLAIDYRMQPEFKTVDCHEDARKAYRWILANSPVGQSETEALFVAGDSAGGNLTLSVIAWARDQNLRAADGAIAFAPLTDASMSSPTWKSNRDTDPFLGPSFGLLSILPNFLLRMMMRKGAGIGVNDPMLSPLLGDLAGLPSTLIQVGRDEMLYGDAQRYANKALASGGDVTLQVWPKMVHVFQGFPELPETEVALAKVADFIEARLQQE